MKQKDIVLLAIIGIISAVFSILLSNILISAPKNRSAKVTVVEKIDSNFPEPDKKFFNANSFDPTKVIRVGDDANPQPFN